MQASGSTYDLCVLIPCYNNLAGLLASVKSIAYTPGRLMVLVVDDGSSSPVSEEVVSAACNQQFPVKIIRQQRNSGITEALNTGLRWILNSVSVKYIARLDCSDICHPSRFYKQTAFLDGNPEIGLTGTWCTFSTADGRTSYQYTTPVTHPEIMAEMHFRNVFIHPTVMFRASLLPVAGLYPEAYPHAEDYAFFMQLARYTQTAVLNEFLVTCEINSQGISMANRQKQLQARYRVVSDFGTSAILKFAGKLKLKCLMLLPYSVILKLKQKL